MDKNFEWFLKADLTKYAGKYVAIAEKKVVLSGMDPGKVYEKAKRKYPKKEVVLWKVPVGDAFIFYRKERCP
ncbi:hypothetical protein B9J78_06105 [bacterium Unc6]|nr:hypothetical protein [bacterium Unc6]